MHARLISLVTFGLSAAIVLTGCSRSDEGKFVPQEATAHQALATALDAWKSGKPRTSKLLLNEVSILVLDEAWDSGAQLRAYNIVPQESPSGPRWYTVKMTLNTGEKTVKYVVLGNDPIWVYTESEFEKLSGTGHEHS